MCTNFNGESSLVDGSEEEGKHGLQTWQTRGRGGRVLLCDCVGGWKEGWGGGGRGGAGKEKERGRDKGIGEVEENNW